MTLQQRTILIIEDNPDFSRLCKYACMAAFDALQRDLPTLYAEMLAQQYLSATMLNGARTVLQAFDLAQAAQLIHSQPEIGLVSVDLALATGEAGLSVHDRSSGHEPGGMRVLQTLRQLERAPLAVVVTGETLMDYAREAFQRHKVLAFFQKARFEPLDYQQTVLAALWYSEASHLIERIEQYAQDPDFLQVARACWQRALACRQYEVEGTSRQIDLSFPEDLGLRIELAQSRLDPMTGRPGSEWTRLALKRLVIGSDNWALLQVRLVKLAPFQANYPSQLDALYFMALRTLRDTLVEQQSLPSFVGLIGREYREVPCLVAILEARSLAELERLAALIVARFTQAAPALLPFRDRSLIERLPQLALSSWSSQLAEHCDDFADLHAAIDRLNAEQ